MSTNLKDKVLGSLVGFAVGDAMGATTEFMTKEQIRKEYGYITEILGGGWLNLKKGMVTDDTQMMLCVGYGMLAGHPDEDTRLNLICKNFVDWLDSNPPDVGNCCRVAISSNRSKGHWSRWLIENSRRQHYYCKEDLGNGGLMRCLIPCLTGDITLAVNQSNLTHYNPTCIKAVQDYFWEIQNFLADYPISTDRQHMDPTGHVVNTVNNAIYWATIHPLTGIVPAVNDGGDADTIAALTGGLIGAHLGFKTFYGTHPEWVKTLDKTVFTELRRMTNFIVKARNNCEYSDTV